MGLLTLGWIWQAGNFIKENRDIDIVWDIDPDDDRAGWEIHPDGSKVKIRIDDPKSMRMANNLKT